MNAAGEMAAGVDVKNTGSRAGDEVVRMYAKHLDSAAERPVKELHGFQRIPLQPNETRTVRMPLKGTEPTYWNTGKQSFVVEPGRISIMVGPSSADVRLEKTIEVKRK